MNDNTYCWKYENSETYNKNLNTDDLKYSKTADCLSVSDAAKPYFSQGFTSSEFLITGIRNI